MTVLVIMKKRFIQSLEKVALWQFLAIKTTIFFSSTLLCRSYKSKRTVITKVILCLSAEVRDLCASYREDASKYVPASEIASQHISLVSTEMSDHLYKVQVCR